MTVHHSQSMDPSSTLASSSQPIDKQPSLLQGIVAATILCGTLLASQTAMAGANKAKHAQERFTVRAKVVNVSPIYREVQHREPIRQCWTEESEHIIRQGGSERQSEERRVGGADTLVGGVIGGVIGNQLGRRGGDTARAGATIAGAIIGSAVANSATGSTHQNRHSSRARHRRDGYTYRAPGETVVRRPVERCETRYEIRHDNELDGYEVTYRFARRTFTTRTASHPGSHIEVAVTARPFRH